MISVFEKCNIVDKPINKSVLSILKIFREDKYNIQSIYNLSKKEKNEFKKNLPIACFNGKFSHRSIDGLIEGSGLMIIDIDEVDISTRSKYESLPYVYAVFKSPSNSGLKLLIRIPKVSSDAEFKEYFKAFEEEFPEVDPSSKDISRACFFSYDPDLYINENCTTWIKKWKPKTVNDYSIANRVLNIIRYSQDGQKHDKLRSASVLMGGYVPKYISYAEAERLLQQEIWARGIDDFSNAKKTIKYGLEKGMERPLSLDDGESILSKEELEYKLGKVYYTLYDLEEELEQLYKEGVIKGNKLSFECASDISFKLGATTYIYGAPFSGKTQFWLECLIDLSVHYGWKHAIFSPETGKAVEIFIELMTIYSRQDFYSDYGRQMTIDTKDKAKEFVDKYFIVLDPDDKVFEVEQFYDYVDIVERVYNTKIHTTTIDPFNELSHSWVKDGRQDAYLERVLGYIRRNARANDRHNCILTHVQDQVPMTKDGVTFYPPASYRQISGGQAWSRKGEQMLCIWRPPVGLKDQDGYPYSENQTVVFIQKSKPKGVGRVGNFNMFYDIVKHSYYERNLGVTKYASRTIKNKKLEQKYIINTNLDDWNNI